MKKLDDAIDVLRNAGEHLVSFNYPRNDPALEDYIGLFKTILTEVDGYTVRVHFNKMDYGTHFVETCQMSGENVPFLPFPVVAKIGQKFLGSSHLSLIEQAIRGKMYWCWAICTDSYGHPIPWMHPMKTHSREYNGFAFQFVKPGEVDFH